MKVPCGVCRVALIASLQSQTLDVETSGPGYDSNVQPSGVEALHCGGDTKLSFQGGRHVRGVGKRLPADDVPLHKVCWQGP